MHLFSFAFCFFKQKSYSSIIAELRDPGIQDPIFFNSLKYNKVNCLSLLALITQWGWTYLILSYLTPLFIVPDGVVDDMQIWSIWDIGCQEAFHDVMGLSHFIYALRKAVRGGNKIFLESAIQRKLSIIMQVMVQFGDHKKLFFMFLVPSAPARPVPNPILVPSSRQTSAAKHGRCHFSRGLGPV